MTSRSCRLLATLAILSLPALVQADLQVRIRIEEQSACRLLAGGYLLSFVFQPSFSGDDGIAMPIEARAARVTRATVKLGDEAPVEFVSPVVRRHAVPSTDSVSVGDGVGQMTAHIPLSTDPADWPSSLLPGDYTIRFGVTLAAADDTAGIRRVDMDALPLAIHVPDPTAVQECPFDLSPPDLLLFDAPSAR